MANFGERLRKIQDDYSSPDPSRRLRGLFGKIVVEEGLAVVISLLIFSIGYIVDVLVVEVAIFTSGIRVLSVVVSLIAFWGWILWGEVILDTREYDSEMTEE